MLMSSFKIRSALIMSHNLQLALLARAHFNLFKS